MATAVEKASSRQKDGTRQHPVDGKTDVFPEQLADIIAEQ
jgi:hypothetical protein